MVDVIHCPPIRLMPELAWPIDQLEPIGLAEMESLAALTERRDRKYLVDGGDLSDVIGDIGTSFRALEIDGDRCFRYESVYFDTPELVSYLMTARGRPRRFKVRTRSYLDSFATNLEIKERQRDGLTVKRRWPHRFEDRDRLTSGSKALLAATSVDGLVDRLGRTLTVNYTRSTLVDTRSWSRVTFDTGLTALRPDGRGSVADGFVLVETKSVGHPTVFDHVLWSRHYRPTSISKYGTLMAALDPSLPANKWNRTLRQHFDWEAQRGITHCGCINAPGRETCSEPHSPGARRSHR